MRLRGIEAKSDERMVAAVSFDIGFFGLGPIGPKTLGLTAFCAAMLVPLTLGLLVWKRLSTATGPGTAGFCLLYLRRPGGTLSSQSATGNTIGISQALSGIWFALFLVAVAKGAWLRSRLWL